MEFPRYISLGGLQGGAPENSLAAIGSAVQSGYAVMVDVRFTADKRMVVFRDEDARRMCGENLCIAETDYADLLNLRLGKTDERIPLLAEVLRLIGGKVPIFITLCDCAHVKDAEKRLAHMLKKYRGEVAVQSFNPVALRRLQSVAPEIVRGQLVSTYAGEKRLMRAAASVKPTWRALSKPQYIAWDLRCISLEAVFYAADIGAHFMTWVANTEQLMEAAEQFSGSVIFDSGMEDYFGNKQ